MDNMLKVNDEISHLITKKYLLKAKRLVNLKNIFIFVKQRGVTHFVFNFLVKDHCVGHINL